MSLTRRKVMQKHDMRRFHDIIVDEVQKKIDGSKVVTFSGSFIGVDFVTFEELQTTDIPEEIIKISEKIKQETL